MRPCEGIGMCGCARHCVFKLQLIFSQANTSRHNDETVSPQESNETKAQFITYLMRFKANILCVHTIFIANEQTAMAIPFRRMNKYFFYAHTHAHAHTTPKNMCIRCTQKYCETGSK